LLFLALKLCGVVDWSWWWIAAPLWGPPAALLLLALAALFGLVATAFVAGMISGVAKAIAKLNREH
jgi:hypothetical protein